MTSNYHTFNVIWAALNAGIAVALWRAGNWGLAMCSGIVAILCAIGSLP